MLFKTYQVTLNTIVDSITPVGWRSISKMEYQENLGIIEWDQGVVNTNNYIGSGYNMYLL